jgi:hypothetical protein
MQLSSLAHLLVVLNKELYSSAERTSLETLHIRCCVLPCQTEVDASWQLHQLLIEAEAWLVIPRQRQQTAVYEN